MNFFLEKGLTQAFIDGRFQDADGCFAVHSPASGELVAEVAQCGAHQAATAADAAVKAFEAWKQTTGFERSALLEAFHDRVMEHKEELAQLMTWEMGKPIKESRGEVNYAAGFLRWYAEEAKRNVGETIVPAASDKRMFAVPVPVGPVYAITPWNFPLAMITRKLGPALAAGCSMILKPAEQSPLTALAAAYLFAEAGGPDGLFQVLTTDKPGPLSEPLFSDRRMAKLSFTGSAEVGVQLYARCAPTVKRLSLEHGGNAPLLVFADADLEQAAEEALKCKFRNAGQTCVCANRIYVQESAADAFMEAFKERVARLQVGMPAEETTDIGPLVDEAGYNKVQEHLQDALDRGASLVTGGEGRCSDGVFFFEPTIISGVTGEMKIAREETFGPIAPVFFFQDEQEAITAANDTPYGLAAYAFTSNLGRAVRLYEGLDYGIVGINDGIPSAPHAPFGGRKASGIGREGGHWGMEEYLDIKYVSLKL